MNRLTFIAIAVALPLAACASSNDPVTVHKPDAGPRPDGHAADAAPLEPSPDAREAPSPDAAPGAPDAHPGAPDAAISIDAPASPDAAVVATGARVIVHFPAGAGHHISVRGDGAGLNWDSGMNTTAAGDTWTIDLPLASGATMQLKPLLDDTTWAIGPNWSLAYGQTLDVWPYFTHQAGRMEYLNNFHSATLNNSRNIEIYLPPSYDENPDEQYPVVYMHDGQNLWNDADSFAGVSWNVGGAMNDGIANASVHEAIVVGIDNDADRIPEYTPVPDPDDGGGNAENYLKFIITELKPAIDAKYRTFTDAAHTYMIGSSLGGLLAAYVSYTHADVFGAVGAMSPSTWWDNNWIIGQVTGATKFVAKMYLDSGDSGPSNDDVTLTATLDQDYLAHHVPVDYVVQQGGQHGETWWRQRLPGALQYLLGGR